MPTLPIYGGLTEILIVALGGFLGALIKDALKDNCIELPYLKDGKIYLGFIGGAIIGAFVGILFDGNFVTALFAGYVGISIVTNLIPQKAPGVKEVEKKAAADIKKLEDKQP